MSSSGKSSPIITNNERFYRVGQILVLNLVPTNPKKVTRVRILKVQARWTNSCGMIVEILDRESFPTLGSTDKAFLKLYDSRYAVNLRQDHNLRIPWDNKIDEVCNEFFKSGEAEKFVKRTQGRRLCWDIPLFLEEEEWSEKEAETFQAGDMLRTSIAEINAYNHLQDLQGQIIPRLLAVVNLDFTPPGITRSLTSKVMFEVQGILLQYLDGFNLDVLESNAPRESWQNIVDQAINAVHMMDSRGILNEDIRPENFIAVQNKDSSYHVFLIDLGLCRTREENESDQQWGRMKSSVDEEGSIGEVMKRDLKKSSNFDLVFEHSGKYDKFQRHMGESGEDSSSEEQMSVEQSEEEDDEEQGEEESEMETDE